MTSTARFADIKFNLIRAIELFEDLNHLDMDVTAPPSDHTFYKEIEVAQRLNIFLGQLIEEGVFNDCQPRGEGDEEDSDEEADDEEEEEEESGNSSSSSPRSEGFDYQASNKPADDKSESRGSRQSFTDRFKRYIRRIIPGGRRRDSSDKSQSQSGQQQQQQPQQEGASTATGSYDDEDYDDDEDDEGLSSSAYDEHEGHPIHDHHRGTISSGGSPRSQSRSQSRSRSQSQSRSGEDVPDGSHYDDEVSVFSQPSTTPRSQSTGGTRKSRSRSRTNSAASRRSRSASSRRGPNRSRRGSSTASRGRRRTTPAGKRAR